MPANSFGTRFQITTFGESHGPALGVVVDGCPAGIPFDPELLRYELGRRRPGSSAMVSARDEKDEPEVLSGIYDGKTLGTPIAILVRNQDQRSDDYAAIAVHPRPGHADNAWLAKFGHVDPRGGGRSSGRETVARVMGGAVAQMLLRTVCPDLRVRGFASQIGSFSLTPAEIAHAPNTDIDSFPARFPSAHAKEVERLLRRAKEEGKSYGGVAEVEIDGAPAGLGQPVFHKLKADLASAFMGVGATSGVEFGAGFEAARAEGTEFHSHGAQSPGYGGINGGISSGAPIRVRVAFKPTSSVLDVAKKGRHDPCIVPRAIPVLEAMAWLVLADHVLWARGDR